MNLEPIVDHLLARLPSSDATIYSPWNRADDWLAELVVALVEERKQAGSRLGWLNWLMNDKKGPSPSMMLDDTAALQSFHLTPEKYAALKERMK